jgi:hypothetical protein
MASDIRVDVRTTERGIEITNSDFTPAWPLLSYTTFSSIVSDEQAVNPTVPVRALAIIKAND